MSDLIFALLMAEPDLRPTGALRAARPLVGRPAGGPRGFLGFADAADLMRADLLPTDPARRGEAAERLKPAA